MELNKGIKKPVIEDTSDIYVPPPRGAFYQKGFEEWVKQQEWYRKRLEREKKRLEDSVKSSTKPEKTDGIFKKEALDSIATKIDNFIGLFMPSENKGEVSFEVLSDPTSDDPNKYLKAKLKDGTEYYFSSADPAYGEALGKAIEMVENKNVPALNFYGNEAYADDPSPIFANLLTNNAVLGYDGGVYRRFYALVNDKGERIKDKSFNTMHDALYYAMTKGIPIERVQKFTESYPVATLLTKKDDGVPSYNVIPTKFQKKGQHFFSTPEVMLQIPEEEDPVKKAREITAEEYEKKSGAYRFITNASPEQTIFKPIQQLLTPNQRVIGTPSSPYKKPEVFSAENVGSMVGTTAVSIPLMISAIALGAPLLVAGAVSSLPGVAQLWGEYQAGTTDLAETSIGTAFNVGAGMASLWGMGKIAQSTLNKVVGEVAKTVTKASSSINTADAILSVSVKDMISPKHYLSAMTKMITYQGGVDFVSIFGNTILNRVVKGEPIDAATLNMAFENFALASVMNVAMTGAFEVTPSGLRKGLVEVGRIRVGDILADPIKSGKLFADHNSPEAKIINEAYNQYSENVKYNKIDKSLPSFEEVEPAVGYEHIFNYLSQVALDKNVKFTDIVERLGESGVDLSNTEFVKSLEDMYNALKSVNISVSSKLGRDMSLAVSYHKVAEEGGGVSYKPVLLYVDLGSKHYLNHLPDNVRQGIIKKLSIPDSEITSVRYDPKYWRVSSEATEQALRPAFPTSPETTKTAPVSDIVGEVVNAGRNIKKVIEKQDKWRPLYHEKSKPIDIAGEPPRTPVAETSRRIDIEGRLSRTEVDNAFKDDVISKLKVDVFDVAKDKKGFAYKVTEFIDKLLQSEYIYGKAEGKELESSVPVKFYDFLKETVAILEDRGIRYGDTPENERLLFFDELNRLGQIINGKTEVKGDWTDKLIKVADLYSKFELGLKSKTAKEVVRGGKATKIPSLSRETSQGQVYKIIKDIFSNKIYDKLLNDINSVTTGKNKSNIDIPTIANGIAEYITGKKISGKVNLSTPESAAEHLSSMLIKFIVNNPNEAPNVVSKLVGKKLVNDVKKVITSQKKGITKKPLTKEVKPEEEKVPIKPAASEVKKIATGEIKTKKEKPPIKEVKQKEAETSAKKIKKVPPIEEVGLKEAKQKETKTSEKVVKTKEEIPPTKEVKQKDVRTLEEKAKKVSPIEEKVPVKKVEKIREEAKEETRGKTEVEVLRGEKLEPKVEEKKTEIGKAERKAQAEGLMRKEDNKAVARIDELSKSKINIGARKGKESELRKSLIDIINNYKKNNGLTKAEVEKAEKIFNLIDTVEDTIFKVSTKGRFVIGKLTEYLSKVSQLVNPKDVAGVKRIQDLVTRIEDYIMLSTKNKYTLDEIEDAVSLSRTLKDNDVTKSNQIFISTLRKILSNIGSFKEGNIKNLFVFSTKKVGDRYKPFVVDVKKVKWNESKKVYEVEGNIAEGYVGEGSSVKAEADWDNFIFSLDDAEDFTVKVSTGFKGSYFDSWVREIEGILASEPKRIITPLKEKQVSTTKAKVPIEKPLEERGGKITPKTSEKESKPDVMRTLGEEVAGDTGFNKAVKKYARMILEDESINNTAKEKLVETAKDYMDFTNEYDEWYGNLSDKEKANISKPLDVGEKRTTKISDRFTIKEERNSSDKKIVIIEKTEEDGSITKRSCVLDGDSPVITLTKFAELHKISDDLLEALTFTYLSKRHPVVNERLLRQSSHELSRAIYEVMVDDIGRLKGRSVPNKDKVKSYICRKFGIPDKGVVDKITPDVYDNALKEINKLADFLLDVEKLNSILWEKNRRQGDIERLAQELYRSISAFQETFAETNFSKKEIAEMIVDVLSSIKGEKIPKELRSKSVVEKAIEGEFGVTTLEGEIESVMPHAMLHEIGHFGWFHILSAEDRVAFTKLLAKKSLDYTKEGIGGIVSKKVSELKKEHGSKNIYDVERSLEVFLSSWDQSVTPSLEEVFAEGFSEWYIDKHLGGEIRRHKPYAWTTIHSIYEKVLKFAENLLKKIGGFLKDDKEAQKIFSKIIGTPDKKRAELLKKAIEDTPHLIELPPKQIDTDHAMFLRYEQVSDPVYERIKNLREKAENILNEKSISYEDAATKNLFISGVKKLLNSLGVVGRQHIYGQIQVLGDRVDALHKNLSRSLKEVYKEHSKEIGMNYDNFEKAVLIDAWRIGDVKTWLGNKAKIFMKNYGRYKAAKVVLNGLDVWLSRINSAVSKVGEHNNRVGKAIQEYRKLGVSDEEAGLVYTVMREWVEKANLAPDEETSSKYSKESIETKEGISRFISDIEKHAERLEMEPSELSVVKNEDKLRGILKVFDDIERAVLDLSIEKEVGLLKVVDPETDQYITFDNFDDLKRFIEDNKIIAKRQVQKERVKNAQRIVKKLQTQYDRAIAEKSEIQKLQKELNKKQRMLERKQSKLNDLNELAKEERTEKIKTDIKIQQKDIRNTEIAINKIREKIKVLEKRTAEDVQDRLSRARSVLEKEIEILNSLSKYDEIAEAYNRFVRLRKMHDQYYYADGWGYRIRDDNNLAGVFIRSCDIDGNLKEVSEKDTYLFFPDLKSANKYVEEAVNKGEYEPVTNKPKEIVVYKKKGTDEFYRFMVSDRSLSRDLPKIKAESLYKLVEFAFKNYDTLTGKEIDEAEITKEIRSILLPEPSGTKKSTDGILVDNSDDIMLATMIEDVVKDSIGDEGIVSLIDGNARLTSEQIRRLAEAIRSRFTTTTSDIKRFATEQIGKYAISKIGSMPMRGVNGWQPSNVKELKELTRYVIDKRRQMLSESLKIGYGKIGLLESKIFMENAFKILGIEDVLEGTTYKSTLEKILNSYNQPFFKLPTSRVARRTIDVVEHLIDGLAIGQLMLRMIVGIRNVAYGQVFQTGKAFSKKGEFKSILKTMPEAYGLAAKNALNMATKALTFKREAPMLFIQKAVKDIKNMNLEEPMKAVLIKLVEDGTIGTGITPQITKEGKLPNFLLIYLKTGEVALRTAHALPAIYKALIDMPFEVFKTNHMEMSVLKGRVKEGEIDVTETANLKEKYYEYIAGKAREYIQHIDGLYDGVYYGHILGRLKKTPAISKVTTFFTPFIQTSQYRRNMIRKIIANASLKNYKTSMKSLLAVNAEMLVTAGVFGILGTTFLSDVISLFNSFDNEIMSGQDVPDKVTEGYRSRLRNLSVSVWSDITGQNTKDAYKDIEFLHRIALNGLVEEFIGVPIATQTGYSDLLANFPVTMTTRIWGSIKSELEKKTPQSGLQVISRFLYIISPSLGEICDYFAGLALPKEGYHAEHFKGVPLVGITVDPINRLLFYPQWMTKIKEGRKSEMLGLKYIFPYTEDDKVKLFEEFTKNIASRKEVIPVENAHDMAGVLLMNISNEFNKIYNEVGKIRGIIADIYNDSNDILWYGLGKKVSKVGVGTLKRLESEREDLHITIDVDNIINTQKALNRIWMETMYDIARYKVIRDIWGLTNVKYRNEEGEEEYGYIKPYYSQPSKSIRKFCAEPMGDKDLERVKRILNPPYTEDEKERERQLKAIYNLMSSNKSINLEQLSTNEKITALLAWMNINIGIWKSAKEIQHRAHQSGILELK